MALKRIGHKQVKNSLKYLANSLKHGAAVTYAHKSTRRNVLLVRWLAITGRHWKTTTAPGRHVIDNAMRGIDDRQRTGFQRAPWDNKRQNDRPSTGSVGDLRTWLLAMAALPQTYAVVGRMIIANRHYM